jgi:hypothetical protein
VNWALQGAIIPGLECHPKRSSHRVRAPFDAYRNQRVFALYTL